MKTFGGRVVESMAARGPVCVGIDPHAALLADWGLNDDAMGLETFAMTVVEALAGEVAFLKPQSAFFERHGSAGVSVLEKVLAGIREAGALSVLDVKRGDIGSTAAAYADAYLDPSSTLAADSVTVSPFLGFGSVTPFIDAAVKFGGGVFVLALTSNPEGPEVQHAVRNGETVAGSILGHLAALNEGATPLGSFGAVVGATVGDIAEDVAINGPLLVPGFGAQGGTVEDLRRLFSHVRGAVIPTTSRGVLAAGPDVAALRAAARKTNDSLH
ncbi:orotidine-5'-phosphate decarboxylase [soil metagenome]